MNIPDLLYKFALASPPCANARVVAALVRKRELLAVGRNQYKTHPLQARYGRNPESIYLHAEIDAIARGRGTIGGWGDVSLYILRIKKASPRGDYILGLAKPCLGCMQAIIAFGINNVCYSTNEGGMKWL